jgi:GT2 family glycosyltransferase
MSVSKPPSIAVCILNWNGKSLLEQYLPSVIAYSQYPNTQLVMIDNASTDDSLDFVQKNYPQITLVCNTQNLGFVGGYNVGLKHVSADYYVLLNSDVAVSANWIAPIVELMTNDPSIFAVQPKIRSDLQPTYFEYAGAAGGCIDRLGYIFCRGRFFDVCEIDNGQYNTNTEIFWASGAAMFVHTRTRILRIAHGLKNDLILI